MNLKAGFVPDIAFMELNPCATVFAYGYGRVNLLNIFKTVIGWTNNTGCGSNGQKVVQLSTATPEKPPAIHSSSSS